MTMVLALLAAVAVGTSDFVGGLASRRASPLAITTFSHLGGAVVGTVIALFLTGRPTVVDLSWGAIAGMSGACGILSIYAGYARATVAIVAPIAGVGAAGLPAIVDAATGGEGLSAMSIVGVALGLVSIALVSITRSDVPANVRASLWYGLGGALGLGLLLLGLARTGEDAGMWPVAMARLAGFVALILVMIVRGERRAVPRSSMRFVLAIAVLNTGANALYVVATRVGSATVAAVLTSLGTVVTVLWAWRLFGERLRFVQVLGVLAAIGAVALIALG